MYRASSGAERLVEFGTTCTAAVVQQGRLLVGNAGDSSAVLGRCSTADLPHHPLICVNMRGYSYPRLDKESPLMLGC